MENPFPQARMKNSLKTVFTAKNISQMEKTVSQ